MLLDDNKNSENSEEILCEENVLHTIGVNQESLEHYPGTFTAIGIGGTFIGILFALVPIKDQIETSDLIQSLLNGAGTAFITSIFGILSSIAFLIITRFILGSFQSKLFSFRMALNGRLQRFTSTNALIDIQGILVDNLEQIRDALGGMADDISEKIGKVVTESTVKAIEGLQGELGKIVQSAGSSSQEIVSKVLENISDTISKLDASASTQADVLDYFDNSMTNATKFAEKMEQLLPDIIRASNDFALSADKMKDLPEALSLMASQQKEFSDTTKASIDLLMTGWQGERERLTILQDGLKDQFDKFESAIGDGIENSMGKFDEELSRAGTYIATWMDDLNANVTTFNEKLDSFSSLMQNGGAEIQNVMKNFSATLEANVGKLDSGVVSITESLNTNLNSIVGNLTRFPEEINQSLDSLNSTYQTSVDILPAALKVSLDEMLAGIRQSTDDIQIAYKESADALPELLTSHFESLALRILKETKSKGIFSNFLGK